MSAFQEKSWPRLGTYPSKQSPKFDRNTVEVQTCDADPWHHRSPCVVCSTNRTKKKFWWCGPTSICCSEVVTGTEISYSAHGPGRRLWKALRGTVPSRHKFSRVSRELVEFRAEVRRSLSITPKSCRSASSTDLLWQQATVDCMSSQQSSLR